MQTPTNLPYQAYKSKRHSRNSSGQNQLQSLSPNVSPPHSRPPIYTNGNGHALPAPFNGNGFSHTHGSSDPIVPIQRDFTGDSEKLHKDDHDEHETEKAGTLLGGAALPMSGIVNAAKMLLDETRRSVSMSDVVTAFEARRHTSPPPTSPETQPIVITTPSPSTPSPNSVSPPEQDTPLSPTSTMSSRSSAPPTILSENGIHKSPSNERQSVAGPSSTSSTPQTSPGPSPRPTLSPVSSGRRTSTFRHVPLRTPSARPSIPSSPLRPQSMILSGSRTASGLRVSTRVLNPHSQSPQAQTKSSETSSIRLRSPHSRPASVAFDKGPLPPIPALQLEEPHSNAPSPAPSLPAPYRRKQGEIITPQPRSSSLALPQHTQTHPHPHLQIPSSITPGPSTAPASTTPAPSISTLSPSPIPSSTSPTSSTRPSTSLSTSSTNHQRSSTPRTYAFYRPGFQAQGVYRPRTDEFLEMRRTRSDVGRVERTRLERRLEKLINLHFPHPDTVKQKVDTLGSFGVGRPGAGGGSTTLNRRASSFFDLDIGSLRGKSAGELWRGVVSQAQGAAVGMGGGLGNSKVDIRAAEQTITPWEEDKDVKECHLCKASFHPLTNRKHHCRLCGRIICSLPIKYPQRPQTCSLLFVADPVTGAVEEVTEGVDYGVRRRTVSTQGGQFGGAREKGKGRDELSPEEKFLKGVRICRECKPVLLRKQYIQEAQKVPLFTRFYEAFISLEKEIEDALPHFEELMVSLSQEERPSAEASAARKRLLEAFAQYDALAKRMRKLPCPGGPGSSQDRVQQAIILRANNFLQKNMFPLQALPKIGKKPSHSPSSSSSPSTPSPADQPIIDPDSEVARTLQPLLEQEALLESFVEEAKTHRKFEDAQTLKSNLKEIRAEIDRVLASANGGLSEARPN